MNGSFLADAQRRLWGLITWPEGVREALDRDAEGATPLDALVRSDERLDAEARLTVYANAYFYRIHDVLAESFETLAARLGEDAFHDLVTSYLAVHPSRHPSLRRIGARLPGFLAEHPAAEGLRERHPWAADLARLEAAVEDVFDAADAGTATREHLAALAPEQWDALVVRLHPAVRLLELGWPAHEARAAVRTGEAPPVLEARPTHLCLSRRDERVVTREIAPAEAGALAAAREGVEFGMLCARAADALGEAEAPTRAATWLAAWVDAGLLLPPGA